MGKETTFFLLLHLSVLIFLSFFVAEIHGRRKEQGLGHKFRPGSAGGGRSLFEVKEFENIEDIVSSQEGLKEKDKIEKLPGQPEVKFSQYGGYLTVDKKAGRAFYYYFVEAQQSKDTLPLLLWLNGGPGCSSLGYGAMQELGPFRVHSDGKTLYKNRYPWNYAANVLFLESPAGVGFSYSNKSSDYATGGDSKTAADNYVFLVNWLERFPEYKKRDFYIAGESYAGHYVPQLAHTILHHNKNAKSTTINLKGILIGNAVINEETDTLGFYDFLNSHAIISDEIASDVHKFCNFSPEATNQSKKCNAAANEAQREASFINIYNIYAPLCKSSNLTIHPKKISCFFDPCSENYVEAYMNRPDVQEALHANVTKLTHDWAPCSDVISAWLDSTSTVLPLLHEFLSNGLRIWVFSGDIDGRVPVTASKYSIEKMKLHVETMWHPWFLFGEVGGYTQVYKEGLTFATVREAGHQVPSYQPARSLSLVSHFLNGTPLPNTRQYNS